VFTLDRYAHSALMRLLARTEDERFVAELSIEDRGAILGIDRRWFRGSLRPQPRNVMDVYLETGSVGSSPE
jgi:hypothetical protein